MSFSNQFTRLNPLLNTTSVSLANPNSTPLKRKRGDPQCPTSPVNNQDPPEKLVIQFDDDIPTCVQTLVTTIHDDIHSKIDNMHAQFKKAFQFQDILNAEHLSSIQDLQSLATNLQTQLTAASNKIQYLTSHNTQLQAQVIKNETYSRRENLIFRGVPNSNLPPIIQIRRILHNMRIPNAHAIPIARCHYLNNSNTHKQIIVRFISFVDRERVWDLRKNLRGSRMILLEDFPPKVEHCRRELNPIASLASTLPGYNNVQLKADKLVINKQTYTTDTLHNLPKNINPRYTSERQKDNCLVFGGISSRHHPLSNYYQKPFTSDDGQMYTSIEQGYQHKKCTFDGNVNSSLASQILACDDPARIRSLGQRAHIDDITQWDSAKDEIMYKLLHNKFTQNCDIKTTLLDTNTAQLIEANGKDAYWASGLPLTNPRNLQKNFPGKNRLGELLEKLRSELKVTH